MARRASTHPTDGELEILNVLWDQGPLGLSQVCETMRQHREVATTTVATMLRVMHDKQLVRRRGEGRGAQWAAAVTRQSAATGMVAKLVDHVFDGAADRLAAHLIEGGQLSRSQLAELRELIDTQSSSTRSQNKRGRK